MQRTLSPLVLLSIGWLGGLLCASATRTGAWQPFVALACFVLASAIAASVFVLRPARPGVSVATLACLVCAAFGAGIACGPRASPPRRAVPAGMARLEVLVEHAEPRLDGTRAILRVVRGARVEDGAPIASGTWLAAAPLALPEGARLVLLAKLTPRAPFRNESPHPSVPPRYEVGGNAWIAGPAAVQVVDWPLLARVLDAARGRVRESLNASLAPRAAGVARALVLGDGQALDALDEDDIRGAGLLHALAVSGLHVAILAGLFVAVLRAALVRVTPLAARFDVKRFACAAGVPLAPLYAAFAGGAPSAWRAALSAAIAWSTCACGLRPDSFATTALAAIALGAFDPELVTRPAFLLSIVATASVLASPPERARDLTGLVKSAFAQSTRASLATAPIVLWCFGSVPIAGVLANVVLLPFASIVLVQLSALHACLCTFTPFGAVTAATFSLVDDAFLSGCGVFARLSPSGTWPPPDVAQGLWIAASVALVLALTNVRARAVVVAACCAGLLLFELALRAREQPNGRLRVTFLDVGQGDAALVDLPDGQSMLIDAGGNPAGGVDPGMQVIVPLLRARRRACIELVVLTHPHPDHYGGLRAVLENTRVKELWDTGQAEGERELQPTSGEAANLLTLARARGVRVRKPNELCGRSFEHAGARIKVLAPCPGYDPGYDANDNSIVLRIDYGKRSFLFAGDAEEHTETRLLEHASALRADVLKVAHHGSRTSSSAAFLHAVVPELAIISAGAGNRFGHPHAEVLARLRPVRHVLRLDEVGGTIVESDGHALRARTWSGDELRL